MFATSLAYAKSLDKLKRAYMNFGMQVAYTNSYLDYSKLNWEENYLGAPLTETFVTDSYGYFDVNVGGEAYYIPNRDHSLQGGFSAFHLNKPVQTFLDDKTAEIPRKFIANIGGSFPVNGTMIYPKIIYSRQLPHQELVFGAIAQIKSEKSGTITKTFYAGILNRFNDAAIVVAKMDINQWSFNFSYDINYSSLTKASHYLGGPEIAIQYIGKFTKRKPHKIYCPTL